jgi:hypothetical protein
MTGQHNQGFKGCAGFGLVFAGLAGLIHQAVDLFRARQGAWRG